MKKLFLFSMAFFFCLNITAQENKIKADIEECIGLLEKSIPAKGFQRIDRTAYKKIEANKYNNSELIVYLENGQIVVSFIALSFYSTNEASNFNSKFYDFFENKNNNWSYYDEDDDGNDIYVKNGVYAIILKPTRRDDGNIIAMIGFTKKNPNDL